MPLLVTRWSIKSEPDAKNCSKTSSTNGKIKIECPVRKARPLEATTTSNT